MHRCCFTIEAIRYNRNKSIGYISKIDKYPTDIERMFFRSQCISLILLSIAKQNIPDTKFPLMP